MDFDFPSTNAATPPRDSNDVFLIQQNHADWELIIGFVTRRSSEAAFTTKSARCCLESTLRRLFVMDTADLKPMERG